MNLGIFRTSQPVRPPGVERELWDAVMRGIRNPHQGPTESESAFIVPRVAELLAELTHLHHEDIDLAGARRALDSALLEHRLARNREADVETVTSLRIQAGRSARHRVDDLSAPHLIADGARADVDISHAQQRRRDAEQLAENRNLALQTVAGALADRMLVVAREALPRLHQYVALLNTERARTDMSPLPNLPAELPEQLVLEARRRAGEIDPDHKEPPS